MADQILASLTSTGVDLDDMNSELIVAIVRGVAGDALANSLEAVLNNMNVKITATLSDVNGNEISSDTVEFVVEKNLVASVLPTGVHITNKNIVPLDVGNRCSYLQMLFLPAHIQATLFGLLQIRLLLSLTKTVM